MELLAETPLQGAHVQPDVHRQGLHAKSGLSDNHPKFVRFETLHAHTREYGKNQRRFSVFAKSFLRRALPDRAARMTAGDD